MKRLLVLLGLGITLIAQAATWVPLGISGTSYFDIDADSIERSDTQIKAWFRENLAKRTRNPLGKYYRSVVTLEVFDCDKKTIALEKALYYSEPNEGGNVVGDYSMTVTPEDFSMAIPGSIGELKLDKVCNGTIIENPKNTL